eukprot:UN00834
MNFSIESTSISRTRSGNVSSKTRFKQIFFILYWLFVEAPILVKRGLWVVFHQVGSLQNEQSLPF